MQIGHDNKMAIPEPLIRLDIAQHGPKKDFFHHRMLIDLKRHIDCLSHIFGIHKTLFWQVYARPTIGQCSTWQNSTDPDTKGIPSNRKDLENPIKANLATE